MCGIFGLIKAREDGGASTAFECFDALLSLQHRGQDSAGIASFHADQLHLKKGLGLVGAVFNQENLSLLSGNIAVGHVRYSTAGSTTKSEAQPFTVSIPLPLALVHNGNLVNTPGLRSRYFDRLESSSDSEVLLQVLSESLLKKENCEAECILDSVEETMGKLNGSYSVVCLVGGKGLLAFRDARAIRPLVMGKGNESIAFASETVAFDAIGMSFVKDLKGGEVVFVDNELKVHSRIVNQRDARHCMFEYVYFARPDSVMDGKSVYEARKSLGRELAKLVESKGEVVIPVPDTSRIAAASLAEELGLKNEEGLIKNRYVGRTFIMPKQKQREQAVKLNTVEPVVKGRQVILVDDSIVRGTTSRKIVKLVKQKAKKVHLVSTCPPIKYPCYYGIDFPLESELIAHDKNEEQIRKEVGADELTYMNLEGLKRALDFDGELCTACLTKDYPTPLSEAEASKLAEERETERKKAKGVQA